MQIAQCIDTSIAPGACLHLGDLDGDGAVEFLLYYHGPYSSVARVVAIDGDGRLMWEFGDPNAAAHHGAHPTGGICLAYDIDGDGQTEVLIEAWDHGSPRLYLLEGATGRVKHSTASPFDMSVRAPEGYDISRSVPAALVAHMHGPEQPATVVLKYEASQRIPPMAVGLDGQLSTRWQLRPERLTAIGHMPAVVDLAGDGREAVVLGELAVAGDGRVVFEHRTDDHADMAEAFALPGGGAAVAVSVCNRGPAFVLDAAGRVPWQMSRDRVPHGQAVWVGNFIHDRPGLEAVVLRSGHVGDFVTVDAATGAELAAFEHLDGLHDQRGDRRYPDVCMKVDWTGRGEQAIWAPVDRAVRDGRGRVLDALGEHEARVVAALEPGTSKGRVGVQAIAADLCGDDRQELVLYQPYHGRAVFVVTQDDADPSPKAYRPQESVYNHRCRSYF